MHKKLLTEEQEQECWHLWVNEQMTRQQIADQLGVSRDTVSRAINNHNLREHKNNG